MKKMSLGEDKSVNIAHSKVLETFSYSHFSEESLAVFQTVCQNYKIFEFLVSTHILRSLRVKTAHMTHDLLATSFLWISGVKLIFPGGHISPAVAFKGLNVTLGQYKCNYSLPVK